MHRTYCAFFFIQCIFINFCLGELSSEEKEKVLNGFIDSLNNLPDQPYTYEEGVLLDAQKTNDATYKISARLKVSDIHDVATIKILKCSGSVAEDGDKKLVVEPGYECTDEPGANLGNSQDDNGTEASVEDTTSGHGGPVKLFNEVQSDAEVTSGEQFVAIPRASPIAPCIGCASHVDPAAAGVTELANLCIRHLDLHDSAAKHALRAVVEVERQVQVVNGVRYILTLLVDYNNCTASDAVPCPVSTPCKVSVLEKPWKKLPDGSKYRAIIANNCTAEWQFGDEGEVLPVAENNENNEIHPDPTTDPDGLKVVHNFDLETRPNQEKINSGETLKKIEDQIIPYSEFQALERQVTATATEKITPSEETIDSVHKDEVNNKAQVYNENSAATEQSRISEANYLSEDKKKAIDDILNYFDFATFNKSEVDGDHLREKRSYDEDLKIAALVKKIQKVNNVINNANYMQRLAQTMVDYLNNVDMITRNRVLIEVLVAEEEFENNQHFFYLQALVTIPCEKAQCNPKESVKEICSGVIENTNENVPIILNAFCYGDDAVNSFNKEETVSIDDPILVKLVEHALNKIETESVKENAMQLVKILDATSQKASGTLTKIFMSLAYTNCKKSLSFYNRMNCSIVDDMGTSVCEVEIHERKLDKNMQITYICTERSPYESFSDSEQEKRKPGNITDPEIRNMVQEALKNLEIQSNRNEKQKVVDIKSVSTKLVAGLLTKISFTVGYTNCRNDKFMDVNTCELLQNVPFRECEAQVWDRPWFENGRQINVKCKSDSEKLSEVENNEIPVFRKKRSPTLIGGEQEQNPSDRKYMKLATESLDKYRDSLVGGELEVKEIKITRVTTQVVSGSITRIDFDVYPTNGEVFTCHSKVWEQAWLNKKDIKVECDANKQQTRAKRSLPGGQNEQNPDNPEYMKLAQESLDKYRESLVGGQLDVKEIKVTRVTKQVVSGFITRIDFVVYPTNGEVFTCHSKVWEQAWLNKKDIKVDCDVNNQQTRTKRQIVGGLTEKTPNDPEYMKLAQESLDKYRESLVGGQLDVKEIKVTRVTEQVVSGFITRIDFVVYPTNGEVFTCHSKVWEQAWLNKKDIKVDCDVNNQQTRTKRQIVGGLTEKNPNDPVYMKLAQESLDKYRESLVGGQLDVKEIKIASVTTQVVSGSKTRIDFDVFPTNGDVITCHSEIWEQPWLKKKNISVTCGLKDRAAKEKREIYSGKPKKYKSGSSYKEDVSKPQFRLLATESLQKYMKVQDSAVHHEVVEVKKVVSQVVAGELYEIDFTAVPTSCSIKEVYKSKCIAQNHTILFCHTRVWRRLWSKSKEIDVTCKSDIKKLENNDLPFQDDDDDDIDYESQNQQIVHPRQEKKDKQKLALAQEVLHEYERQCNSKYKYRITSLGSSYEQVTDDILTTIEFYASPTQCPILDAKNVDDCKLSKPEVVLECKSAVRERTWLYYKEIKVSCKNVETTKLTPVDWNDEIPGARVNYLGRERRNVIGDEDDDYMDDDMKFYYADRAVQHLNQRTNSHNIQKLITIQTVDVSNHMGARMVRMYIETALTFCVRQQIGHVDLSQCDEMEGLPHKLCHVRLWPSLNDEMIIRHIVVVCDDHSDFSSVTGFEITKLISASLRKLESSPKIKYKLVHQGEPYIKPSLSSRYPITMNFIVLRTNCTKDIDVFKHRDTCFIDTTTPATSCESQIYLSPNSKEIKDLKARCFDSHRQRRDVSFSPAKMTTEDITIEKLVDESLEKLETSSVLRYKQRVLKINSYFTKITRGRETRIDFDVGYSSCLKYESVRNVSDCEFIEQLPRRHCMSIIYERLWIENGRNIQVSCEDDGTPLESQMEFENADTTNQLANEALKHIEAKYPNAKRLQVVRVFSVQKQAIAGFHYRLKIEVGLTDCPALSVKSDCNLVDSHERNKFCRVNVWIRPWTDRPPSFRVTCDYQESETAELYHRMQAEHLFADFLATHKPDYMDDYKEMSKRFKIFRANVRKVHELNIHEKGTARYAMTRFSDMTYEEFSSKYLGLKPSLRNENNIPMIKADIPKLDLPQSFDWRDHGAVTEVKDQGSCGSCWAFSVTGNIEGQWKLQTGKLLSLSEQELVDCDKQDQGCNGGLMDNAYRAIEALGGLETEADYPYEGEDDKCEFNKTLSKVQISGAVNISSNETEMAQWLVGSGPISIGINAAAMQFYVGGISHPWKMLCSPKNLDHGVLIVGFGAKDYPLFHKHLPYWIVKNSWGLRWGEQGYYRVYRGDGTCGVNQMASSAVV